MKMDPNAKRMRYKTWPILSAWREIFGKDRATGERSADPYKDANAIRNEEMADTQDCYVPNAEWNPDIDFVGLKEEPTSSFNANVDPTGTHLVHFKETQDKRYPWRHPKVG